MNQHIETERMVNLLLRLLVGFMVTVAFCVVLVDLSVAITTSKLILMVSVLGVMAYVQKSE